MALFSKNSDKKTEAPQPAPAAPAAAPAPAAEPPKPEAVAQGVQVLGEIASVMMRSPNFQNMPLGAFGALVTPALAANQFVVVRHRVTGIPAAVCLWACVSPEVDARLSQNLDQPAALKAEEWKGGEICWVIAAAGEQNAVRAAMSGMHAMTGGKDAKIRTRDDSGTMRVAVLKPEPAPSGAS